MPKRIQFHVKSRKGCKNCKLRRVKCDEVKPQCTNCSRRGEECLVVGVTQDGRHANRTRTVPQGSSLPCVAASTTTRRDDYHSPDVQIDSPRAAAPSSSSPSTLLGWSFPPTGGSVSTYSSKSLLDLRLMHHYCIFTAPSFADALPQSQIATAAEVMTALTVDVPRLAYQHEFLMDAVLLVAMVHMVCCYCGAPAEAAGGSQAAAAFMSAESLPIYLYRDQALRSLRHAVATISDHNMDAVRGASVLLAHVSFATDRVTKQSELWVVSWMTLAMGQRNFRGLGTLAPLGIPMGRAPGGSGIGTPIATPPTLQPFSSTSPALQQSGFGVRRGLYDSSSAADHQGEFRIPAIVQHALRRPEGEREGDEGGHVSQKTRTTLFTAARELGRLMAIIESPYETVHLERKVKAWAFDMVPSDFLRLVQQRNFKALVILAHYLVLFKLLNNSWLYQDLAQHDVQVIQQYLSTDWLEYLSLVKLVVDMDDKHAIAQILLSSLEDGDVASWV
ncbi:hypothetical protein BX600DRAFT_444736 [Xylariales sp. PMI_506]|nr:hypothetical protein BX600DRAFT_444736 [Xylariales sp. PMI_506]